MSNFIDQEIFNLNRQGHSSSSVAVALIELLDSNPLRKNSENISSLARYLLLSGQDMKLINYVLENIQQPEFPIPWPYFLEALTPLSPHINSDFAQSLKEGIVEQKAQLDASRSDALKQKLPELQFWGETRQAQALELYKNKKIQLLDQLSFLRAQRLYAQEKELLKTMLGYFPNDPVVRKELEEHKERYAFEILSRKKVKPKSLLSEDLNKLEPDAQKILKISGESVKEEVARNPQSAFDFAVAAFMMEAYEEAYELLANIEEDESILWFKLEVLLKTRRFLELLTALNIAEQRFADDPETFFATAYLRAQALWGLGQKSAAREVMTGLLAARPHYRAAAAIMSIWSQ